MAYRHSSASMVAEYIRRHKLFRAISPHNRGMDSEIGAITDQSQRIQITTGRKKRANSYLLPQFLPKLDISEDGEPACLAAGFCLSWGMYTLKTSPIEQTNTL